MKNGQAIRALIDKINLVTKDTELASVFSSLGPKPGPKPAGKPVRVAFVNAHALNLCFSDPAFLQHLLEAEYVFRDGSGMKILYKMLGRDPGLNLNGTDLIPRIIGLYKDCGVALLGTGEPYLSAAAGAVRSRGAAPVLTLDGFRDDATYLEAARENPASLIILAMGMPKQERVAALLAKHLDYPCLIICGGAILDFMGGKVTRAPLMFRRFGIEWLYRLAQEPRRLFRRYIIGNFVFLYRSMALAMAMPSGRAGVKVPVKK